MLFIKYKGKYDTIYSKQMGYIQYATQTIDEQQK